MGYLQSEVERARLKCLVLEAAEAAFGDRNDPNLEFEVEYLQKLFPNPVWEVKTITRLTRIRRPCDEKSYVRVVLERVNFFQYFEDSSTVLECWGMPAPGQRQFAGWKEAIKVTLQEAESDSDFRLS